ncbi:MAG: DUF1003 domain-containing protein [Bacteroidota bacterium]|jgi:uncharacterized membrane protein
MEDEKIKCSVTGKPIENNRTLVLSEIQIPLRNFINSKFPDIKLADKISDEGYELLLNEYVEMLLSTDRGELSRLELEVISSIKESEIISSHIQFTDQDTVSWGDRMADKLASFGGSWYFVLIFMGFLGAWILFNLYASPINRFDTFPFILLNLILSSIAALQAPVIMMSQNRAEAKDRKRSEHDYQINLKAEIEIRSLNQKMDHLLMKQMQHLTEIQQLQIDLLEKIRKQINGKIT